MNPKPPVGIPHFHFAGAHPIFPSSVRSQPGGGWLRVGMELAPSACRH
jgi:hypothetical protein